jgi:Group II intron, maturase-specific domain
MSAPDEESPGKVSCASGTKQSGEARLAEWGWVEHSVWTERMLEALRRGVRGGVWFSLIDKVWRPATWRLHGRRSEGNGYSLEAIIKDVNQALRGWFEYFKHSHKWTFSSMDEWVRRRFRSILRRRRHRKGISRGFDHQRWPNAFFRAHGLFSLEAAHRALLQSPRG